MFLIDVFFKHFCWRAYFVLVLNGTVISHLGFSFFNVQSYLKGGFLAPFLI